MVLFRLSLQLFRLNGAGFFSYAAALRLILKKTQLTSRYIHQHGFKHIVFAVQNLHWHHKVLFAFICMILHVLQIYSSSQMSKMLKRGWRRWRTWWRRNMCVTVQSRSRGWRICYRTQWWVTFRKGCGKHLWNRAHVCCPSWFSGGERSTQRIQDSPGGSQPESQDHYTAETEKQCVSHQGQITHSSCLWLQTNGGKPETLSCVSSWVIKQIDHVHILYISKVLFNLFTFSCHSAS